MLFQNWMFQISEDTYCQSSSSHYATGLAFRNVLAKNRALILSTSFSTRIFHAFHVCTPLPNLYFVRVLFPTFVHKILIKSVALKIVLHCWLEKHDCLPTSVVATTCRFTQRKMLFYTKITKRIFYVYIIIETVS